MDFMKMLEDWRRVLARSVLAFHLMCATVGLVALLGVISISFIGDTSPGGAMLTTAAVTGLLCLMASCALGGGVRYAVYGDFRLLTSRSFRDYFSGDDDGGEGPAHVSPPLSVRTQRGSDDDLVDRGGELVSGGDMTGFMDVYNRLQGSPTIPPGEISEELTPRIRELGLERNCHELWEQGYTVIEDVAPSEYWRDLARRAERFDAVVLHHQLPTLPDKLFWKELGPPLIVDFDDALPFRHRPRNGGYNSGTRRRRFARILHLVDAFARGNTYLRSLVERSGKPTCLILSAQLWALC